MPPPVPASVKDGRMIAGKPISACAAQASSIVRTMRERGLSSPIASTASRKRWRSSAFSITSASAPIISTPYFSSTPFLASAMAAFSAVCPPIVGRSASGFSCAMMVSMKSGVIGSI